MGEAAGDLWPEGREAGRMGRDRATFLSKDTASLLPPGKRARWLQQPSCPCPSILQTSIALPSS